MATSHLLAAAAGAGAVVAGERLSSRLRGTRPLVTARHVGSSTAAPGAALWVTDLLNAAYYARPDDARHLDDLRLAFAVLTTDWHQRGVRPLGARDLARYHRAFGRLRRQGRGGRVGTLDTDALLAGGARLLGDWFPDAASDPDRRGWGVVFRTSDEREAFDPSVRLARAPLGPVTPPFADEADRIWSTYPPVEVADAARTLAALHRVERWPEYASELGRFTPVRAGGLAGQTFEIEVIGAPTSRTPVLLRAYVSVELLLERAGDPAALDAWMTQLRLTFASRSRPSPVPPDAEVEGVLALVSHEGHFMGRARSQLVVYRHAGRCYLQAIGTWDPLPWHLAGMYEQVGRAAQHQFWGMGAPQQSMLHQIATEVSRSGRCVGDEADVHHDQASATRPTSARGGL